MDPHTARWLTHSSWSFTSNADKPLSLQLSTSICMPFNPYRPHRFPDPISRSRFPVTTPLSNTRMIPPSTIPPKAWSAPVNHSMVYPQRDYTHQQQHQPYHQLHRNSILKARVLATPAQIEASYFQPCITPDRQIANDPWDEALKLDLVSAIPNEHDDLGLSFENQEQKLDYSLYDGGSADSLERLVHLDDVESWNFDSTSPDRQSWLSLSASSGEAISDFTDFHNLQPLDNINCSSLDMAFTIEDTTPRISHIGPKNKTSQLDSYSIFNDFQTWENSTHTRQNSCNSIPSSAVSTTSQGLSSSQCCSPSDEYPEFIAQDLDFSFDNTSSLIPDNILDDTIPRDSHSHNTQLGRVSRSQYPCDDLFSMPSFKSPLCQDKGTTIVPSSGHFDLFHNHGSVEDRCGSQLAEFAEVPDLFGALQEEQLQPDAEDMKPDDKDLEPRGQDLRFEGDLYTPKYVRGHGNMREGWCGICKPGRWLVLKNSAYWYDKSFTHGISAASGMAFDGPKETRRMNGNPDVWEGLCGSCGDWIALISSKKKGTTWFRHAYKCHTHQKLKETPKRRRECNQVRSSKTKKAKHVSRDDSPDSVTSTKEELEDVISSDIQPISALHTISSMV